MSRKLDAAIAEALGYKIEEVFGYEVIKRTGEQFDEYLPHYSADGNAMLELDAEMQERGWWLEVRQRACVAVYTSYDGVVARAVADTMPEAVALAAYKALTGDEWHG